MKTFFFLVVVVHHDIFMSARFEVILINIIEVTEEIKRHTRRLNYIPAGVSRVSLALSAYTFRLLPTIGTRELETEASDEVKIATWIKYK